MRRKIIFLLLILLFLVMIVSVFEIKNLRKNINNLKEEVLNMKITINDNDYEVILENNETVKELVNKLPFKITMEDLNNNEKYYYFSESFSNAPINISKIEIGDIMLYGNNCLVIFYDNFKTTYKYTKIGKIKNIDNLQDGNVVVEFKE